MKHTYRTYKEPICSIKSMRVNSYPQAAIRVTLIDETLMNKWMQAKYEGMRVKTHKTFF